jgi:hypothetical protein
VVLHQRRRDVLGVVADLDHVGHLVQHGDRDRSLDQVDDPLGEPVDPSYDKRRTHPTVHERPGEQGRPDREHEEETDDEQHDLGRCAVPQPVDHVPILPGRLLPA